MEFRIQNKYNIPDDLLKLKLWMSARNTILLYHFGTDEQLISNYLFKTYGLNLRSYCLKILFNARIHKDYNKQLIVKIPNKNLDKIARLITYGNGLFVGSQILKQAFMF